MGETSYPQLDDPKFLKLTIDAQQEARRYWAAQQRRKQEGGTIEGAMRAVPDGERVSWNDEVGG